MQAFYISRDGEQLGPFTENELRSKIQAGEILQTEPAWTDGLAEWLPVGDLLPEIDVVVSSKVRSASHRPAFPPGFSPKSSWVHKMVGPVAELEVYDDRATITVVGVMGVLNRGLKGTKTIPFQSIMAVQFKKAGITRGFIQFTIPGGNESKAGVFDAVADENTFLFDSEDNSNAETVRRYIESRMKEMRTPQIQPSGTLDLGDQLTKLAVLKTQGLLSDEEFQAAKKRLIG